MLCERHHGQRLLALLARADIRAASAACAVIRRDSNRKLVILHAEHRKRFLALRKCCRLIGIQRERTDNGMRAYIRAACTLDAVVRIPDRHHNRNAALLICSRSGRCRAVNVILECGDRQLVALLGTDSQLDVVDEIDNLLLTLRYLVEIKPLIGSVSPGCRYSDLVNLLSALVDGCPVLLDDIIALAPIGCLCSSLHQLDCPLLRDDGSQLEECGLKDGVDTGRSHTDFDADLDTIDRVELDVMLCDICLHLSWNMLLQLLIGPRAVQQEGSAVNQLLNHVELADVCRIMACNKVCLVNQVGGLDRLLAEAEVGHRHAAGLLGIIIKVCLRIHVGVVADDLDGVLVCTDRSVRAKAPELAVDGSLRCRDNRRSFLERQACDIIDNADGELFLCSVLVNSDNLCRCRILASQSVTACENRNILEL